MERVPRPMIVGFLSCVRAYPGSSGLTHFSPEKRAKSTSFEWSLDWC
jgi:hypothetical protein